MKRALATLLCVLSVLLVHRPGSASGADILGSWEGGVATGGGTIPLVIHVAGTPEALEVTLDSPDQGAFGLTCENAVYQDEMFSFDLTVAGGRYEGQMSADGTRIEGTWYQGGGQVPLTLKPSQAEAPKRPQMPEEPYPYTVEEVSIASTDDVMLSGTLTLPGGSGPFPAVVLVTGSGPQDRDESISGHKPFLVLADHLTRNGIAVLRYDDRGVAESTGKFTGSTSTHFAADARAAAEFLDAREETGKVGILGHSEGGLIGPLVARDSDAVDFVIMLAGPAVSGYDILIAQTQALAKVSGFSQERADEVARINARLYDAALGAESPEAIRDAIHDVLVEETDRLGAETTASMGATPESADRHAAMLSSPWFLEFMRYDPTDTLAGISVPLLAIYGGLDLQVLVTQNAPALEAVQPKAEIVIFEDCNHLFQVAETGAISEYATIEETMAPKVLGAMSSWILEQDK